MSGCQEGRHISDSNVISDGSERGDGKAASDTGAVVGERVEFVTPHCDPTVDRYDAYHVVHGDRLVAIVPINAARASR